jgi:hypothetical protein
MGFHMIIKRLFIRLRLLAPLAHELRLLADMISLEGLYVPTTALLTLNFSEVSIRDEVCLVYSLAMFLFLTFNTFILVGTLFAITLFNTQHGFLELMDIWLSIVMIKDLVMEHEQRWLISFVFMRISYLRLFMSLVLKWVLLFLEAPWSKWHTHLQRLALHKGDSIMIRIMTLMLLSQGLLHSFANFLVFIENN